ncbi:MAG: hypothetical protein J7641_01435 [Cyanobacteria bacterium SID2]|nr:hypothetical protein [Cyanobacteria bacterium SID2]MBP0005773.1 hypothetical protein [Cyanobacteria bacterium SBC]
MNSRKILFCSVVTAAIGTMLGIAAAELANPPFESGIYKNPHRKYAIAGAILGAAVGGAQETVRQLKAEADRRERERERFYRDRFHHLP